MSDFDFDELDKAVSNVLSDKESPKPSFPNESEAKPASESPSRPQPEIQADTKPETVPSEPEVPQEATPSPAPIVKPRSSINRRPSSPVTRRGGVIDIMAPPSKRPSRESTPLQLTNDVEPAVPEEKPSPLSVPRRTPSEDAALRWPPKTDEPAEPEQAKNEEPAKKPVETKPEGVTGANIEPDGSFERFDSLSRSGFDADKKADTKEPITEPEPEPEPQLAAQSENNQAEAVEEPETDNIVPEKEPSSSQSPFLTDAKVEKRPLGAFSATQPAEPQELKNPDKASYKADTEAVEPLTEEKKLDVGNEHLLEDGHEHDHEHVETPKANRNSTSMSALESIPQQYKIAPEPHDEGAHKVFDTNEYHAPLHGHNAKVHRGGNGLLIASIVLLVLAVIAAAGIYFYGDKLGL